MTRMLILLGVLVLTQVAMGQSPKIGEKSPDFTLEDISGNEISLSDYQGKLVVLEWSNHGCPFVKKHYQTGNMQKLQEKYTEKGVVWLTICSSASGKQGYLTNEEWSAVVEEKKAKHTAVLPDPDGKVGRMYGAKTTPHMFIIDTTGKLVYQGAIDDERSWDPKTVEGARNYVAEALEALLAGKEVELAETKSYGCSVKY